MNSIRKQTDNNRGSFVLPRIDIRWESQEQKKKKANEGKER